MKITSASTFTPPLFCAASSKHTVPLPNLATAKILHIHHLLPPLLNFSSFTTYRGLVI